MRLEPFCRVSMRYRASSWHRPYAGEEGLGFGQGDGEVSGELDGALVWANYPRRREDGVWTPNLRGTITTRDGDELLVSIHGQSVEEDAASRRAILARVELTTEVERWRWLNTCFLVGEGEIDEEREHWWLDVFLCVNEQAQGRPAIGAEPPKRFRQTGTARRTLVWTDGSCNAKGMQGRGGWAALIMDVETVREISGSAEETTHNRMELTAICEALETLRGPIEIRTDSTYVQRCFRDKWHERWLRDGSWKGSKGSVKNRDLWERLFGLVWDESRDVTFVWIKGHAGDPNNHRVDRLAQETALSGS